MVHEAEMNMLWKKNNNISFWNTDLVNNFVLQILLEFDEVC